MNDFLIKHLGDYFYCMNKIYADIQKSEYQTVFCVVAAQKESCLKDAAGVHMLTKHDRLSYVQQQQVNMQQGMTSIQSVQPVDVLSHIKQEDVSSDEVDTKFQFQGPVVHCQNPSVSQAANHCDSLHDHTYADSRLRNSHSGVVTVVGDLFSHTDTVKLDAICLSDQLHAEHIKKEPYFTSIGSFDGPGVKSLETSVSLENVKEESDSLYDSDCTESANSGMFTELFEDETAPLASEIKYISSDIDANKWTGGRDRQHTQQCSDAFYQKKKFHVAGTSKLRHRSVLILSQLDFDLSKLVVNIFYSHFFYKIRF